jgi:hypothetical protein
MNNVAVCSISYNSASRGHLPRHTRQCAALDWPHEALRFYVAEGDSVDNTWAGLNAWAERDARVRLGKHDLHFTRFKGSVADTDRLRCCSFMASYARAMALTDGWADWLLWVESDLIWEPDLLARLMATGKDYVAPWVMVNLAGNGADDPAVLRRGEASQLWFYDTWGFRHTDGRHFTPLEPRPKVPFRINSAGSCLLVRAEVARRSNEVNDLAIVGWCDQARAAGYEVWADPATEVWHPWPRVEV